MLLPIAQNTKTVTDLQELIEDHMDERDAAELSREDRGTGIPLKTIAKNINKG